MYPLLPGRGGTPLRTVGPPIVMAFVMLSTLLVWLALKDRPSTTTGSSSTPTAALAPPLDKARAERRSADLAFHLTAIRAQLLVAAEQGGRAQRLTAALVPALTRNDLWLERRRAETAVAASEDSKQAVDRALAELNLLVLEKE
jgi:hypothetical protein